MVVHLGRLALCLADARPTPVSVAHPHVGTDHLARLLCATTMKTVHVVFFELSAQDAIMSAADTASRIHELSEELSRSVQDANTHFRRELLGVTQEFEAARAQLRSEYAQRVNEVQLELEALASEQEAARSSTRQNEVVSLNVGGALFTVKRETLCVCRMSFMAELFSGRWDGQLQRDSDGIIFLDLDPMVFELLLNWLRDKKIETPGRSAAVPLVPPQELCHFQAMVDYWGLRSYIEQDGGVAGLRKDGWELEDLAPRSDPEEQHLQQQPHLEAPHTCGRFVSTRWPRLRPLLIDRHLPWSSIGDFDVLHLFRFFSCGTRSFLTPSRTRASNTLRAHGRLMFSMFLVAFPVSWCARLDGLCGAHVSRLEAYDERLLLYTVKLSVLKHAAF